jgi:hypothetical protein
VRQQVQQRRGFGFGTDLSLESQPIGKWHQFNRFVARQLAQLRLQLLVGRQSRRRFKCRSFGIDVDDEMTCGTYSAAIVRAASASAALRTEPVKRTARLRSGVWMTETQTRGRPAQREWQFRHPPDCAAAPPEPASQRWMREGRTAI